MKLKDIIPIDNPAEYRLHFAKDSCRNGGNRPLDDYAVSFSYWANWHKWYRGRDRFHVKYIISFMDFYPKPGSSLFGGIFEVLDRHWDNAENAPSKFYDIRLVKDYSYLIGCLRVSTPYTGQQTVITLDEYANIDVIDFLPAPYAHYVFQGYENIG